MLVGISRCDATVIALLGYALPLVIVRQIIAALFEQLLVGREERSFLPFLKQCLMLVRTLRQHESATGRYLEGARGMKVAALLAQEAEVDLERLDSLAEFFCVETFAFYQQVRRVVGQLVPPPPNILTVIPLSAKYFMLSARSFS